MNIPLREGNRDAFRIEALLNLFLGVEAHVPVIRRLHPWTHHEIDAAVGELQDGNRGRGFVEDPIVLSENRLEDRLYLIKVKATPTRNRSSRAALRSRGGGPLS